jgi:hypothetical protein
LQRAGSRSDGPCLPQDRRPELFPDRTYSAGYKKGSQQWQMKNIK